jgi:hypothetical protein
MSDWLSRAEDQLLRLRDRCGAWGYRRDRGPTTEVTAIACLGLWSLRALSPSERLRSAIQRGADWLLAMQQADGSLGLSSTLPSTGWATPYAILLWNALESKSFAGGSGLWREARRRACAWLIAQTGNPAAHETAEVRTVVGHDTSIVGWPWIAGTHSWLEPTAMSILALDREGRGNHPRVTEGLRLLLDRAIRGGGWNYGNTSVFGSALRPQPGPTGLALLALAARAGMSRPRPVDPAIAYLRRALPDVRAPISLAWGVLGLRAWSACPVDADTWLARSFALHASQRDITLGLGLLLLAGGNHPFPTKEPRP